MQNNNVVIGYVATAIVVGGIGFYGGTLYQKSKLITQFGNRNNFRSSMGQRQGSGNMIPEKTGVPNMMGRGAVMGEVTAKDEKSITVKMSDGSSRNIILSDSTTYRTSTDAKADDINTGTKVAVFGTGNSDGSTTATNIEINPRTNK